MLNKPSENKTHTDPVKECEKFVVNMVFNNSFSVKRVFLCGFCVTYLIYLTVPCTQECVIYMTETSPLVRGKPEETYKDYFSGPTCKEGLQQQTFPLTPGEEASMSWT